MGAGGPDHHPHARGDPADGAAQLAQLAVGLGDVPAGKRRDLQHRLVQLGLDVALDVVGDRLEDALDPLRQLQRLGVADHQLLLDSEGEGRPAEVVIEHARSDRIPPVPLRHQRPSAILFGAIQATPAEPGGNREDGSEVVHRAEVAARRAARRASARACAGCCSSSGPATGPCCCCRSTRASSTAPGTSSPTPPPRTPSTSSASPPRPATPRSPARSAWPRSTTPTTRARCR